MDVSFCIVNTNGREHLLRCLRSVGATLPAGLEAEVLVLDNASGDGSAPAAQELADADRGLGLPFRLVQNARRLGKAENDTLLLRSAKGEFALLLNEDSEVLPGCVEALVAALRADPHAAAAGAQLVAPDGSRSACAWRLPGVGTALAQALFLHRVFVTQSGGSGRSVGWVQSAAMLIRVEAAAEVSYLDPEFFVYSDETDFCKRLGDAGWRILYVPEAEAIHHEQLTTDISGGARRAVEFHRNRDRYMRKHHTGAAAAAVRGLTAWSYAVRAAVALLRPGADARRYWAHAALALRPRGEGIREAAAAHNARLGDAGFRDGGTG